MPVSHHKRQVYWGLRQWHQGEDRWGVKQPSAHHPGMWGQQSTRACQWPNGGGENRDTCTPSPGGHSDSRPCPQILELTIET